MSRNGTYGASGHKRQRYRCVPHDQVERDRYPSGGHFFTPPLAREHLEAGAVCCSAS